MRNIIYCLVDPFTSEIRYIGKTRQKLEVRLNKHIQYAKKNNIHVSNWIKTLLAKNSIPIIKIIEELSDNIDWRDKEIYYINLYKSLGCDLTNLTNGGEGMVGFRKKGTPCSIETRRKIGLANKAIKKTPEWNEKASIPLYKPVYYIDKNNVRMDFPSLKHAALFIGDIRFRKNIGACLKKKRPTAYGYKWFYKEDLNNKG